MSVQIPPPAERKRIVRRYGKPIISRQERALVAFEFLHPEYKTSDPSNFETAKKDFQRFIRQDPTGELTSAQYKILNTGWMHLRQGSAEQLPNMVAEIGVKGLLRVVEDPQYPVQFGDPALVLVADRSFPLTRTPSPSARAPVSIASYCDAAGAAESGQQDAEATAFCARRDAAMSQANYFVTQVQMSETDIRSHCNSVGQALAQQVSALKTTPASEVLSALEPIVEALGLAEPSQAQGYGNLCLGLGYDLDNDRIALAGALLLVSAGATAPAQIISDHLSLGLGALPKNPQLAEQWSVLATK